MEIPKEVQKGLDSANASLEVRIYPKLQSTYLFEIKMSTDEYEKFINKIRLQTNNTLESFQGGRIQRLDTIEDNVCLQKLFDMKLYLNSYRKSSKMHKTILERIEQLKLISPIKVFICKHCHESFMFINIA